MSWKESLGKTNLRGCCLRGEQGVELRVDESGRLVRSDPAFRNGMGWGCYQPMSTTILEDDDNVVNTCEDTVYRIRANLCRGST